MGSPAVSRFIAVALCGICINASASFAQETAPEPRITCWRDRPSMFPGPQLQKLVPAGAEAWQWAVNGAADAKAKVQALADAGVNYLLLAEVDLWTAEELTAAVGEARLRGLPVHAIAERPADVERGVVLQFDGFLGTGMGTGPFPDTVVLALHQRLMQPAARTLSWTPAISALLNYESLRENAEPLDDPRTIEQLPPLVAANTV